MRERVNGAEKREENQTHFGGFHVLVDMYVKVEAAFEIVDELLSDMWHVVYLLVVEYGGVGGLLDCLYSNSD